MSQAGDFTNTVGAIRSASALTETTFVQVGKSLETSIEALSKLTSSFEGVLADLEGENLGLALRALSGMAARIRELGENQSRETVGLEQIRGLAETIGGRIAHMKGSLKDADSLAVNSRIAVASIRATTIDFTAFAGEIGRTLNVTRATLDQFAAELLLVRQDVAAAHTARLAFERRQHEAVNSITERLSATVTAITEQNQRAARASLEVRLGSARIQQRIRDAVLASQIGDVTRQRFGHADDVFRMVAAAANQRSATGLPLLDEAERSQFSQASYRLQAEQLADAARNFDHEVRQIVEFLYSLAAEARALRDLGNAAFGSAGRDGGTVIAQLEGQIGEALVIFEDFETARAEVASVTATVSRATDSLCGHLRTVQSLEADIRIIGLNATFKCARIGNEGLALGSHCPGVESLREWVREGGGGVDDGDRKRRGDEWRDGRRDRRRKRDGHRRYDTGNARLARYAAPDGTRSGCRGGGPRPRRRSCRGVARGGGREARIPR